MEIKFDTSSFAREAVRLGAVTDRLPAIFAEALNHAAFSTRKQLVQTTWPTHVKVYNPGFIKSALRVNQATENNLSVEIVDSKGRGNLALHAFGGTRTARSGNLAIPIEMKAARGPKGIPAELRPRALLAVVSNNTKTKRIRNMRERTKSYGIFTNRSLRLGKKTAGIFVGIGGRLHMLYAFKSSVNQPADVPFLQDFNTTIISKFNSYLPGAVKKLMAGS